MAPTLFISDLHLAPERPRLVEAFHSFMRGPARGAAALYAIGDLFDAWLGDDQVKVPLAAGVAAAFADVAAAGTPVYLQRDPAPGRSRPRSPRYAHADHARRPALHRRRRLSALPCVLAGSGPPPAAAGAA